MKLIYFELENFLSIFNATGKTRFSFNRENSSNRIILILGRNGSGKSSILDELTPLPLEHTNYRNKSRIMKNKIGKKIIIYQISYDLFYKIEIIYDKKTVCYISKSLDKISWEELNKNGNVNSYLEILENELGFSKNYTKVGYLSSAISNFIVMKPSERNEYISEWLPNIDIYLKAHKIVMQKHNQKKREIDTINRELGKVSNINFENDITNIRNTINEITNKFNSIKNNGSILDLLLDKMSKSIPYFNKIKYYASVIKNNKKIMDDNKKELKELLEINRDVLKYSNDNEKLKELINETNLEIIKNKETLSHFNLRLEKIKESIKNRESNLENKINQSLIEVETRIKNIKRDIEILNEEDIRYSKDYSLIYEYSSKMNYDILSSFNNIYDNLINLFSNMNLNKELFSIDKIEESINNNSKIIESNKKEIIEINKEIDTLNRRISLKDNSQELNRIFNMKPENCSINTCNLLKELSSFLQNDDEFNKTHRLKDLLKMKISKLEEEISNSKDEINNLQYNLNILVRIIEYLNSHKEEIAMFPNELVSIFTNEDLFIIKNKLNELSSDIFIIKSIVYLLEKIKNLKNDLNNFESLKIKILSQNQLKEDYEEFERIEKSIDFLKSTINRLEEKLENLNNTDKIRNKIKENIEFYNDSAKIHNNHISILKELAKNYYWYNSAKDLKLKNELDYKSTERTLEDLEKEKEKLFAGYHNKTKLEEMRNEALKSIRRYKVLADTWSPKIGYASWEISAFLDILKEQTNKDLSEMWGSELQIESFNIDLNEFSIKINKNENLIDDAILCSSGEQATLVTAISFAIIALNTTTKMYNILRLDEVDAVLDSNKRKGFMDILIDRIEKMNCQSCFVVTHNNEFDTIPADVILMSDIDEINLDNKNIIYKI